MNSMEMLWVQMLAFAVLLLIGYGACKIKLWQKAELHAVSKFLVNIAIPIMKMCIRDRHNTVYFLKEKAKKLRCIRCYIAIKPRKSTTRELAIDMHH